MGVFRHLGQGLAGELGRQRLHHRHALLLVQRGEDFGQIGRLEIVGPADEQAELALPDQVDHPVEELVGIMGRARAGRRVAAPERISSRSIRVGEA